jgi:hypothetical protein
MSTTNYTNWIQAYIYTYCMYTHICELLEKLFYTYMHWIKLGNCDKSQKHWTVNSKYLDSGHFWLNWLTFDWQRRDEYLALHVGR